MQHLSFWPIFISWLVSFILGGFWYSDKMYGETWRAEAGVTRRRGHKPKVFAFYFALSAASAVAFAMLMQDKSDLITSLKTGLLVGLFLVGTAFGINYAFAGRSFKLFLIDAGYFAVQYLLFGIIFGIM